MSTNRGSSGRSRSTNRYAVRPVSGARNVYGRRALLHGAAAGGLGIAGAALFGCGRSGTGSSSGSSGPSSGSAGLIGLTSDPNKLIGRIAAQSTGETPQMGGVFNAATGGNPPTLDPHRSSSGAAADAVSPVLSRLLRFKPDWDVKTSNNHDVEPDLALSLESPDALTWTVKLRQGVKFQNVAPANGHAVEPQDIKATFIRAVDPAGANRGSLDMIDPAQIETPAPDTVVFKLRYPYAPFAKTLASPSYSWILPREAGTGAYDPAKVMIGSGPFILDSYTPDIALVYRRNPDYWEKGKPYVDSVKQAIVPDPAQQIAQFGAGNLDFILNISKDNVPTVKAQNPKADAITYWGPGDGQIHFPMGDPPSRFRDIRIRQAISLSLDRAALSKIAFDGASIPTFYAPQSLGKWALKMEDLPADTADWYKFDLARGKQLLKDTGADTMTVKYVSPTPLPPSGEASWLHVMREAAFNMIKALGWDINFVLIDYNKDWVGGGKGVRYGNMFNDTIVFGPLEGRTDVDEYIFGWYGGKSTTNLSHLKDPTLDSMIDQARKTVNEGDRVKAYIDTQKYMAKQMFSVAGNPGGLAYQLVQQRVRNFLFADAHSVGESAWSNLWLRR